MHNLHTVIDNVSFGELEGKIWVEWQKLHWIVFVIESMLPEDNTLPKNHYEAKKILCVVGMEYRKTHVCPNDCILYKS